MQKRGAPSRMSWPEVFVGTGHYGVAVVQPWAISRRQVADWPTFKEIQKTGRTIASVVSRGFRVYRILWGRDRPTLRKIDSTSSAIRGKHNFYEIQNYSLKIREIQKSRCTIADIVSRGFDGYRTLCGSGHPTLRNIASPSSAIWGKLHDGKLNLQPEVGNCPKWWPNEWAPLG